MASRPFAGPETIANAQVVSGSTVLHFSPTIKPTMSKICYSMSWTGTLSGTFTVEVSGDYSENVDGSVRNAGTWNTLPTTTTITASGTSGNGFYEIGTGSYAIRLTYTPGGSPGAGTITVVVNGQVQ